MNKSYDNSEKDYSIYVYGKIYELIEHLNSYHLKCYINNEKNVDLLKEFKYKKKNKWKFVSILDYHACFKNKKCEFDVIPIIFDKEYEILYIGVSVLFKENFWEEYNGCSYNYIELFIYNLEIGNEFLCTNNLSNSSKSNIFKFLINIEDLSKLYKEDGTKNDEDRVTSNNTDCNDKRVDFKNYNYFMENINNEQALSAQEKDLIELYEQRILYSNNASTRCNDNSKFKLSSNSEEISTLPDFVNNVNHLENDMSTYRNDTSYSSSSSSLKKGSKLNDADENYKFVYDYENNWKNGNGNKESNTDIWQDSNEANPINHSVNVKNYSKNEENIISQNTNEGMSTNDSFNDPVEINKKKMTYYKNVQKMNDMEEKTYFIYDKSFDREFINYEYSYRKNENETMYLDETKKGHKWVPTKVANPFTGSSCLGSTMNLGTNNNIRSSIDSDINSNINYKISTDGCMESVCMSVERSELVVENEMPAVANEAKGNLESESLNDKVVNYIKHEEVFYNQEECIKSSNVIIRQSEEYRKNVCTTHENSNDNMINNVVSENYVQENKINENEKGKIFKSGFFTSKGNRTYNEDRVITIENINDFINKELRETVGESLNNVDTLFDKEYYDILFNSQNVDNASSYMYCAIYDGHNGEKAVNIIQKFLHVHVYAHFIKGNGVSNSLKYGFQVMDEHLCAKTINNEEDNHSNFSSGSTACVSVIFNNMLYIANIGDSRCVLSKNGRAIVVTLDHRASANKQEEERIINSGGVLDDEGYLGGCLGVCRGFGSFDKKTKEKLKGLVCEPDLFQIKLTDDDEFLIICCDGIFDVMTSQEAVNTVRNSLVENTDPSVAAEALCQLAYKRKSLDNLSVVVIIFQNPETKKKTGINESPNLYSGQTGRVRRRIKFSALKGLISP
ncbi:protein phosphatase PPM1, putative [Plasmodium ovale]|uniref:Protein phosphatase PPM1, putative n=2 Tax=Plasmodium ovale TaxID=36330 RepID=A0A1D3KXE2_PLAOA|nr:protein phosphatase PPM1, putative [Plasmodium ovale]